MPPQRRNHLLWIGPAVVFTGFVSYYKVFAFYPDLRDFPWVNLPWVLIGVALTVLGVRRAFSPLRARRGKILGALALAFSVFVAGIFLLYVFRLSYMLPDSAGVRQKLTAAPQFALTDQDGRQVRLADHRGRKVVLVFYRGHW